MFINRKSCHMFGDDMKMLVADITIKHVKPFNWTQKERVSFNAPNFPAVPRIWSVSAIPYAAAFERQEFVSHVEYL
jgi:hypothetical protein